MTICYNCRSVDTEAPTLVRYFASAGTEPYFLENLPATVCRVCGPTGFSSKTMCAFSQIEKGKSHPVAHRRVPVFDLKNPDAKPEKASAAGRWSNIMAICYNCRSAATVAEKTVCYFSRAGTSPLYVENMPVEVCRVCGIVVFPNPSRAALKQARAGELIPIAHRRVPVFDLKNPDAKPEKAKAAATVPALAEVPGD